MALLGTAPIHIKNPTYLPLSRPAPLLISEKHVWCSMFIRSFRVSKYQFEALCVFFNNAVWLKIDMDDKSASYCDNM